MKDELQVQQAIHVLKYFLLQKNLLKNIQVLLF